MKRCIEKTEREREKEKMEDNTQYITKTTKHMEGKSKSVYEANVTFYKVMKSETKEDT